MTLPLWAFFGLGAAILSSAMMLLQERLQLNAYAAAFWVKVACAAVSLPFVIYHGPATDPWFYIYLALTAVLYAISDIVFYSGITRSNAGAVARLVPASSVIGFLVWFAIDPALFQKYAAAPVISGLIFLTLCLFAFFAFRLKKCEVTLATFRAVWFVLVAALIGPILTKMVTYHAPRDVAIFSYVFFQALMMMALWMGWLLVRRPVPLADVMAPATARRGLLIGVASSGMVLTKFTSMTYVDNPAYIPAIIALDSVLILLFYKIRGRTVEGDIASGLGIVACAAALIVLKAQI